MKSLLGKRKKTKPSKKSTATLQSRSPFQAVKIVCPSNSGCDAVKQLASQHFLCNEAPILPLSNCNNLGNECRCKYKHLSDRRVESRRAADFGLPGPRVEEDKRFRRDRRAASLDYV